MFENIINIFKKNKKKEALKQTSSKDTAKERLHLVLMQDRANVSADFLDLMRKEIIEVIKKYIDIDEKAMDVRLTTETNEDGVQGAPALYANIPIINIKEESKNINNKENKLFKEISKKNDTELNKEQTKENINSEIKEDENKQEQPVETANDKKEDASKQEKDQNPQIHNKKQSTEQIEEKNIEKEKNKK